jgi:hypothetical protein
MALLVSVPLETDEVYRALVRQSKAPDSGRSYFCHRFVSNFALCVPMLTDLPADYETDAVIQESLRTELTVITIAHRLQTIMNLDKIISATRCISSSSVNHQVLDGA